MLGFVNIVKTCACAPAKAAAGSGFWGALIGAAALLIGGVWLYRAADASLAGLAASTAEANRVAGWAFAIVLVVAAITGAVWVLLGRRRQVREAPAVADFQARTDRAIAARNHAVRSGFRPSAIGGDRAVGAVDSGRQAPVRIEAQRVDRLPGGGR